MNATMRKFGLAAAVTGSLVLAGCVTQPYNSGYGYQGQPQGGYYGNRNVCQACGVVQDVQQVAIAGSGGNGGTLGAVIGAVAGGVLGSTIGKGDGRTATTVVGAVAGGVVGNQIGQRSDGNGMGWRIVVRLDNGQYATVTQRPDPGVRNGDYVEVRDGLVYAR
jgi:outer membrane lipoprotein SlyB